MIFAASRVNVPLGLRVAVDTEVRLGAGYIP